MARTKNKEIVKRIFLADGNSIVMRTDKLIRILDFAYRTFPCLEVASTNASAKFVLKKSEEELKELREKGLTVIYMGLETGDDELLKEMRKGVTVNEILDASAMVKKAGIELSQTIIIGLGGKQMSNKHARSTASVLNEIDPDQIRLHTLILIPGTPLYDIGFDELSPREALVEMRELVSGLKVNSELISHRSNYLMFRGTFPEDKDRLIELMDFASSPDGSHLLNSQLTQYSIARFLYDMRMGIGRGRADISK
jgi:radical SAM superfamily enzyme YgiQ (UPF0313 family)